MKIYFKNTFKPVFIIFCLVFIYFLFCAYMYTNATFVDISNNIFRLHVIANSDSKEDQLLKYHVRDSVINYIQELSNSSRSKEDLIKLVSKNKENIQKVAQNAVYSYGFTYPIYISIGNFFFPTKQYGDISLPPGYYDAVRIEIGEAKGKNWWCVLFPPLCFIDVSSGIVPESSKEILKENLSDDEFNLICNSSENISFKFKIVELLQNMSINGIFM